jgi:hypothetical protein
VSVFPPRPAGQMLRRDYSAKFQDPTPRMGQGALGQGIRDKHRYTYLRILGTLYNTYLSSYVSAVPITKRCIDTYRVLICQSAPPFPPLQPSHPRHLSTSPRHPTSILFARANHYIYAAPLIFNSANRDPSTYRCATCIQASTSPCRIPHPASTVVECLLFLIPSHLSVNLSILFINLLLFTSSL